MNGIYLLLGSNLGDRLDNLRTALKSLQEKKVKVLNESSVYETEPWGESEQPWFLNVVVQVETAISEQELLEACLSVETGMGRKRDVKWGVRLIDIDILYYHDSTLETDKLKLPHPEIPNRRFTLVPMCELAPNQPHPISYSSQIEMLTECTDKLKCKLTDLRL